MSSTSTLSNRICTPRDIDAEIGKVHVKLQTLSEILTLYRDRAEDVSTEGFCHLISMGIEDVRSTLCDISEAVQTLEQNQSTEQGALKAVKP